MLANLPLLINNQTLYSWSSLVNRINGHNTAFKTSLELFGSRYAALCHDFPSYLSTFEKKTNQSIGDTTEIALHNTMLGYYLAMAKKQTSETIQESLYIGSISHLKMQLGITASRIGGSHPLKACSECIREDVRTYGYTYWHVEHQPPSVFICIRHGMLLKYVNENSTPVHRRSWLYPEEISESKWKEFNIPNISNNITILTRLASDSEQLMKYAPCSFEPHKLSNGYLSTLKMNGFTKINGSLNIDKLIRHVLSHYKGLETLPGMSFLKSINSDAPGIFASLSRRNDRSTHPLKHLLLIGTLTDSLVNFYEHCQNIFIPDTKTNTKAESNKSKNIIKVKFRNFVKNEGLSITAASREMGISTTTGTQLAKSLNIYYTPRTKYLDCRIKSNIIKQLNKGLPINSIAADNNTSEPSVRRILAVSKTSIMLRADKIFTREKNKARNSFAAICRKKKYKTLREIRTIQGDSYAWLYRNDREWLKSTLKLYGRNRNFSNQLH